MHACMLSHFSRVQLCATPWTAAHQTPPSTGFSRQEHWSGSPFPSPVPRAVGQQSPGTITIGPVRLELCNEKTLQRETRTPPWKTAPTHYNWRKPMRKNKDPAQTKKKFFCLKVSFPRMTKSGTKKEKQEGHCEKRYRQLVMG